MKYKNIVIEKKEYVLLKKYMNLSGFYQDETFRKSVEKLVGELESAVIYDETDMPKDVIRFNTEVTIESENGWSRKFKLVKHNESDEKSGKISILTPMGAALMGYAEGDSLEWDLPSGKHRLTIEKVEQSSVLIDSNMAL